MCMKHNIMECAVCTREAISAPEAAKSLLSNSLFTGGRERERSACVASVAVVVNSRFSTHT